MAYVSMITRSYVWKVWCNMFWFVYLAYLRNFVSYNAQCSQYRFDVSASPNLRLMHQNSRSI